MGLVPRSPHIQVRGTLKVNAACACKDVNGNHNVNFNSSMIVTAPGVGCPCGGALGSSDGA